MNTAVSAPPPARRTLAAVAFADVVNYSAMMAADEARTHAAWMAAVAGVLTPQAESHGGSIVKSTGDGVLVRFGSALDAVEWAEDVQRGMADIVLRISVHLGDVITTEHDIFGDGVNVAARLLEHAEPGGVVMSEAVHDLVRGSVGTRASDLGWRQLKSYERPVRIYGLAPLTPGAGRRVAAGAAMPSIAVLPFKNLSDDPGDVYFADGIVEDIVVSLGGLGELLVVSRSSTLAMRSQEVDPREAGRMLGVRYVLMGTLRRSKARIRVGTQLFDTATGAAIWRETAEVPPGDLFEMQDGIVARVVAGIAPNVRTSELRAALRKRPESFTAYDHTLRAMHLIYGFDGEDFGAARTCLDAAIAEDPFFAMPFAWLAWWWVLNVGQGRTTDPDHDIAQAGGLAARAIELDGHNALALCIYGHVKSFLFHQYEIGLTYLERALAASPNSALSHILYAASLAYTGQGERAVQHAQHGLLLSPLDRGIFFTYNILLLAHLTDGEYDEAVRWGRRSLAENPRFTATHRLLIGALVPAGRIEEAQEIAAQMLALEPDFSVGDWERTRQPFQDRERGRTYAEHLRIALLPE